MTAGSRQGGRGNVATGPWGPGTHFHFIGIGGQSMSGLALGLRQLGFAVTGSDVVASERTRRVEGAGGGIWLGHDAATIAQLPQRSVVVFTTDVPEDNPELRAAREAGLPVVHRSEVLDWFLEGGVRRGQSEPIAVTGTHGKTTTTALIGYLLRAGDLDPTIFVAADVPYLQAGGAWNMAIGQGRPVVAEADESDGSFLRYHPVIAVLTNLEPEHLEHYQNDFGLVLRAARQFLGQVRPDGLCVLCADDERLREIGPSVDREVLWYGLGATAGLTCADLRLGEGSAFTVVAEGTPLGPVRLRIPGRHNVQNALAAIGVALRMGVPFDHIARALPGFEGAARRFQVLGCFGGVTVVDDYAHHPSEVRATLAAARRRTSGRVIAVFQPHRYHRLYSLWEQFLEAFGDAHEVVVTDPYGPAGEARLDGPGIAALARGIQETSGVPARYLGEQQAIVEYCLGSAVSGDVVLVMGAGDITGMAHQMAERLRCMAATG